MDERLYAAPAAAQRGVLCAAAGFWLRTAVL